MLNKGLATGLLLGGLIFSFIGDGRAMAQSALAQQSTAQQSAAKPSTAKSTTAKPAAKQVPKPAAAKKAPPKPLVYVVDNRNPKPAEPSASSNTDTSASKSGPASVKKASATSTTKSGNASLTEKPLSAGVTKAFQQNCPSVALTESKTKAQYDVTLDREPGGKGVKSAFGLRKASKIEVINRGGKELFSENGHSTSQLVKDACTAMGTPSTKIAKN
jgi:predicted lipid-binding transport protein (Tim44 family)